LLTFSYLLTAILLFNEKERSTVEGVIHRMVKRAVEMEGTVTGEHGVGLIKRDYLDHELGVSTVDAMRKVSSLSSVERPSLLGNPCANHSRSTSD
jgi:FAD/FMN-containing dehydrogenase